MVDTGAGDAETPETPEEVMSAHKRRSSRPRGVLAPERMDLAEVCDFSLCARLEPFLLVGSLPARTRPTSPGAPVTSAHGPGSVSSGAPVTSARRLSSPAPTSFTLSPSPGTTSLFLSSSCVSRVRRDFEVLSSPRSLPSRLSRFFCDTDEGLPGLAFASGGGIAARSSEAREDRRGKAPAEDGLYNCFFFGAGSEGSSCSRRSRGLSLFLLESLLAIRFGVCAAQGSES